MDGKIPDGVLAATKSMKWMKRKKEVGALLKLDF